MYQFIAYMLVIAILSLPFFALYYSYVPFRYLFGHSLGVFAWLVFVLMVTYCVFKVVRFHSRKRQGAVSAERIRQSREAAAAAGVASTITDQDIEEASAIRSSWKVNPQVLLVGSVSELIFAVLHVMNRG